MFVPKCNHFFLGLEFCTYPEWVGDGICDDSHNTKRCNFDGNDCCEGTFENCFTCKCHLNGISNAAQNLQLIANCSKFLIGDGVCDWWNDYEFCDFDGGDCRTTTTTTTTPSGILLFLTASRRSLAVLEKETYFIAC